MLKSYFGIVLIFSCLALIATDNTCSTPDECYTKAIAILNQDRAEIRKEADLLKTQIAQFKKEADLLKTQIAEFKKEEEFIKNQIAEFKKDIKVDNLSKKTVKLVSLNSPNWSYNTSSEQPLVVIDYSFNLEVPSTVEASVVGHAFSDNPHCANHAIISFNSEVLPESVYGMGLTYNVDWVNIVTQRIVELGIGTHNVKLSLRRRWGPCNVTLNGSQMILRFYPK